MIVLGMMTYLVVRLCVPGIGKRIAVLGMFLLNGWALTQ